MEVAELIVQKLHVLPPQKQREVLDFVDFLSQQAVKQRPRRDPKGLWADLDLGIDVTAQDIHDARRELWGDFPREDF